MELVHLDLSEIETATELLALQRRAYKVEARLIGSADIPPAARDPTGASELRGDVELADELEIIPGLRVARFSKRLR